jgi:MFS-type transporter involved in bile tolerance (Atg22 family)
MRARTISIYVLIASAGGSLGALAFGSLGTLIGVNNALVLGGVVVVLAAACVLAFIPQVREMRAGVGATAVPATAK